MKIILFGPQGVGKGTYGMKISEKYNIPILSTGQVLRDAIKQGTELGKIADKYIHDGILVPPDVAAKIVNEAVKKSEFKDGYILDGFPRNLEQAKLFEEMDKIDFMIEFYAPEEMLIRRLTGRRTCKECGAIYNIFPDCDPNPKDPKVCDKCGGELYQREDDTEEAIRRRLNTYYEETQPILEKYKDKIIRIESKNKPEEIVAKTIEAIEGQTDNQ